MFYLSGNSRSVHQEENRIETAFKLLLVLSGMILLILSGMISTAQMWVEEIDAFRILHSSQLHCFATQGRNINRLHLQSLLLQGERMATAAGTDIQHSALG